MIVSLGGIHPTLRNKRREAAVAVAVHGKQDEPQSFVEPYFSADDEFQPVFPGRDMSWLITLWIFRDPWGFLLAVVPPLVLVVVLGGGLDKLMGFREPAKRGGTGPVTWEEAQEIARREREKYHHG